MRKTKDITWSLLLEEEKQLIFNPERIENWGRFGNLQSKLKHKIKMQQEALLQPTKGIAVDAYCSGNPGPWGYRGICLETGVILFQAHFKQHSTNNLAEYIGIVHALGYCKRKSSSHNTVYSDSEVAIAWVIQKGVTSKFFTGDKPELAQMIWKCEMWISEQKSIPNLNKWRTDLWGEIPSDFGSK